jgi:hypothetical protein
MRTIYYHLFLVIPGIKLKNMESDHLGTSEKVSRDDSTSKNTMSFLLLLMFSLQQNWRKGQIVSIWKRGGWGVREGAGARGRDGPNNVSTYE